MTQCSKFDVIGVCTVQIGDQQVGKFIVCSLCFIQADPYTNAAAKFYVASGMDKMPFWSEVSLNLVQVGLTSLDTRNFSELDVNDRVSMRWDCLINTTGCSQSVWYGVFSTGSYWRGHAAKVSSPPTTPTNGQDISGRIGLSGGHKYRNLSEFAVFFLLTKIWWERSVQLRLLISSGHGFKLGYSWIMGEVKTLHVNCLELGTHADSHSLRRIND